MMARPPAWPTPDRVVSTAWMTMMTVLQSGSFFGQPVCASDIQGPATGIKSSSEPGASGQSTEVPAATPYQTTLVTAPASTWFTRAELGGSSGGRSCSTGGSAGGAVVGCGGTVG